MSAEGAMSENDPEEIARLNDLALSHQNLGDHAAALPLFGQALEIYRTALGENHPEYASSLNNVAMVYASTGRASEAMLLMEQAAAIDDKMIGQIL